MGLSYVKILFLLIISFSCTPPDSRDNKNTEQSMLPPEERAEKILQEEVIYIHDEVMPKMDQLMMLKARLLMKVDSMRLLEEENPKINELQDDINQLRKADSAMMNWMRQFQAIRDTVSHEQRMEYLQKEKERIEKVREMMNKAIEDAREEV